MKTYKKHNYCYPQIYNHNAIGDLDLRLAKTRVINAYNKVQISWWKYQTLSDNRHARANQYEYDSDRLDIEINKLVFLANLMKSRNTLQQYIPEVETAL